MSDQGENFNFDYRAGLIAGSYSLSMCEAGFAVERAVNVYGTGTLPFFVSDNAPNGKYPGER